MFYLFEDISENTDNPSSTDHIFHDDVTNESMIEIVRTENIEEYFEPCLVDNSKDGEEEVDVNLFEDTEYPSFTDHIVQIDDIDESIKEPLITKNILESCDTCSNSNETGQIDSFKVSVE